MKLWNCYVMLSIYGDLDSTDSYGIFSSREKVIEKITKEYRINQPYNDGDYDYHWVISSDECYEANGEVYQEELILVNIAANDQESICFIISKEEVDKGV